MTALPPAPCHPASQGVIPQVSCPYSNTNEIFLFLLFCLALLDQRRGYNRVRKSQRTWLYPRVRHFLFVRCGFVCAFAVWI